MNLLSSFRAWLQNHHYTPSTVRNYINDVRRYLSTVDNQDPFADSLLSHYIVTISTDTNHQRYLASLNKFCQFGLDQKLTNHNPIRQVTRQLRNPAEIDIDTLVSQFQNYLSKHNHSPVTIKNYINDLRQYINWNNNT